MLNKEEKRRRCERRTDERLERSRILKRAFSLTLVLYGTPWKQNETKLIKAQLSPCQGPSKTTVIS